MEALEALDLARRLVLVAPRYGESSLHPPLTPWPSPAGWPQCPQRSLASCLRRSGLQI